MQTELDYLKSIDASLKALVKQGTKSDPGNGATVASDSDLDGKYGDPEVKMKDPRDWSGDSMIGRRFSQCPADYLDMVASRLDYFATKSDEEGKETAAGKPVSKYQRADAARARGWAKRIRDGKHLQKGPSPRPAAPPLGEDDDPDIPF